MEFGFIRNKERVHEGVDVVGVLHREHRALHERLDAVKHRAFVGIDASRCLNREPLVDQKRFVAPKLAGSIEHVNLGRALTIDDHAQCGQTIREVVRKLELISCVK